MNPVVIVHLIVAALVIAGSIPLIRRKVKMNHWFGVRIPAAFSSAEAWYAINRHGGWLLLAWGCSIGLIAAVGACVGRAHWVAYDWTALVIIVGGMVAVVLRLHAFGARFLSGEAAVRVRRSPLMR